MVVSAKPHGRPVLFVCLLLCILSGCGAQTSEAASSLPTSVTIEDLIQEDGSILFPGVAVGTTREEFTQILGMDYSAWGELVNQILVDEAYDEAPLTFEGHPALVYFPLKDDVLRSVVVVLLPDDATDEAWLETSLKICDALAAVNTEDAETAAQHYYTGATLSNAEVSLLWETTIADNIQQTEDGGEGSVYQYGTLGGRITTITITYPIQS